MKVNDIVEIISRNAFYYGAKGIIRAYDPLDEEGYCYFVEFEMIDEETSETTVYESCWYREDQLKLIKGEC
jgi:hypothetical protein